MKALQISEDLLKEINNKKIIVAKQHSIFNNACNFEYEEKLITILSKKKDATPMSIIIDNINELGFKKIERSSEEKIVITKEEFTSSNIVISLKDVEVYNPYIQKLESYANNDILNKNLKIFENTLIKDGKLNFFYPFINDINKKLQGLGIETISIDNPLIKESINDKVYSFIKDRFYLFFEAFVSCDIDNISRFAEKIIGFGMGLTPSIDDFISGMMISLIALGHYYSLDIQKIYEFNNKLIQNSLSKTTKVSSEMLKHSAKGLINHGTKELINTLLSDNESIEITKALNKVIAFGETSGSDTAFGILIGCKIITDICYRRNWE